MAGQDQAKVATTTKTHVCLTTSCKREIKKTYLSPDPRNIGQDSSFPKWRSRAPETLSMARQKNSEIDAQLRALGAPTGAINGVYNEWEGLPFVEVVPGFLVLQQDLNDVILPAESREPINYDLEEFYLNVSGNRAWRWRIEDGRFIASTGTCD